MADESTPEDLAARLDELEGAIEELRAELRPRGPFGLPRPPTPREATRFAADYGIPAAIATLEATTRSLELLQAALRAADPERGDLPDDAQRAGEAVLDRLDDALADLQATVEGEPPNAAARDLLEEVRRLNEELREAVDGAAEDSRHADDGGSEEDGQAAIENELETIRREVDDGTETDTEDSGDDTG